MATQFPVSVKVSLFNDKNELLMIFMDRRGQYGLPGGHIDEGETPDAAMRRELAEETGVQDYTLRRADFFMHDEGKLILAYTGITTSSHIKSAQNNAEGMPVWVSKAQFDGINANPCYRDFVNSTWPK